MFGGLKRRDGDGDEAQGHPIAQQDHVFGRAGQQLSQTEQGSTVRKSIESLFACAICHCDNLTVS